MHSEDRRGGDRRHFSVAEVVSIGMLVLQFGALIWGAATLSASVAHVQASVALMRDDLKVIDGKVEALTIDVGVMKAENRNANSKRP